MISLNLVLAGLRLGLKNLQVGGKWVFDDCSYLCKGLLKNYFRKISVIYKIHYYRVKYIQRIRRTSVMLHTQNIKNFLTKWQLVWRNRLTRHLLPHA
ncbi:hypothetical protein [bacterium endosymbiont of Bathymodiolus sp. 5 South]|uniref:hypothetical protein n=1 Tax=bacterium endosymbiont of Bathymodiolus sp. 5 South TaxID=1181670 RepID=UPI00111A65F6|nr:hypothetical protein [bacterium endosymbiont of Bathymodiolus sp. 5 South]